MNKRKYAACLVWALCGGLLAAQDGERWKELQSLRDEIASLQAEIRNSGAAATKAKSSEIAEKRAAFIKKLEELGSGTVWNDKVSEAAGKPKKCGAKPVCVEMGTPSVWSLQQAHYLLERNRMLNRTLRAKPLGELDANGVNSERMDIRQTYVGISGEFDQKARIENSLAMQKREDQVAAKAANDARIRQMRARRDQLAGERAELQFELDTMNGTSASKAEAAAKQAEINRLSAQINILNQQIADLGTANVEAVTLANTTAVEAGAAARLTGTSLDAGKALAARVGTKEASMAASSMLDNNLNLQNEILAKQLTLLRDEAGPQQNVIFLELPQSIYTANTWGDDYMVRTKWRVRGLLVRMDEQKGEYDYENERAVNLCTIVKKARGIPFAHDMRIRNLDCVQGPVDDKRQFEYKVENGHAARAVELIPAKSYLHVNDFHSSTRTWNIMALAKTVLGLGLRLDYQNRREAYENFLQQEVHASAMGKGSAEFGWVFGPEPGKRHINPGVRTTYAVMHVPSNTYGLHIEKESCYFKKNAINIENKCSHRPEEDILLAVPHVGNGFYMSRMFYVPAPLGGVATVYLHGEDFSPQTTVLVDGHPLHKALSVGDPRLAAEHNIPGPAAAVEGQRYWGEYEIVNPELIVLRLRSAATAPPGTPDISLISPNKGISIHRMKGLYVNGKPQEAKDDPMFVAGFRITGMKFVGRQGGKVKLMVTGGPFDATDIVEFGGKKLKTPPVYSHRLGVMEFEAPRPASSTWTVLVTSHLGKIPVTETFSVSDPLKPDAKGKATGVAWMEAEEGKKPRMQFQIAGNNFYGSTLPEVKGAGSCGTDNWKTLRGEYKPAEDGKLAEFEVEDPPACVRVSYKPADLDVDGPLYWPVFVERPAAETAEEPDEKKATPAAKSN
jgi:hypothetical protein